MGINEVADALRSWNVNLPVGTLWGKERAMNIQATGQLWNAEEFREMTVAFRNGVPVRLKDVATVVDSVEDERTAAWMFQDGEMKRTVMLIVMRQPNSNVVETNDAVKGDVAADREAASAVGQAPHSWRSVENDSRIFPGRAVHAGAHDRHGDPGHRTIPAQRDGDADSGTGAALLSVGHAGGHLWSWLQPEQHFDDGADPLGGIRGGRRDRHAGEHRPPYRKGRNAATKPRFADRGRSGSRFCP